MKTNMSSGGDLWSHEVRRPFTVAGGARLERGDLVSAFLWPNTPVLERTGYLVPLHLSAQERAARIARVCAAEAAALEAERLAKTARAQETRAELERATARLADLRRLIDEADEVELAADLARRELAAIETWLTTTAPARLALVERERAAAARQAAALSGGEAA